MNSNTQKYAQAIQDAKSGNAPAEEFLRARLKTTADNLPLPLLISLSELMLGYRRDELRSEAERN